MLGDLDKPLILREIGLDNFLYAKGTAHLAASDAAKIKIFYKRLKPTPAH